MVKTGKVFLFSLIVVVFFIEILGSISPIKVDEEKFSISLESREFTPLQQSSEDINKQITSLYNKHAIIQFNSIPSNQEKELLKQQGINLLGYIPKYAWFAKISKDNVKTSFSIRYISEIKVTDKIKPSILKKGVSPNGFVDSENIKVLVTFFSDVPETEINSLILKYDKGKKSFDNTWEVTLKKTQLLNFASNDIVNWIEDVSPKEQDTLDEIRVRIHANEVQVPPYDLHGNGYVVAMWESGTVYAHPDYASRILAEPDNAPDSFHATEVAGIVLGDGTRSQTCGGSEFQWRGIATQASLVSYNFTNYLNEHNVAINTYNADVSQNSWTYGICSLELCSWFGDYDSGSRNFDRIVRGLYGDKITIVGPAGNNGGCTTCQSEIPNFPYGTVTGPIGTSKNAISVSGTQADNDAWWSYSSRGPTDDGRIKPDLSSPACKTYAGITTTYTDSCYDTSLCGTSFSAPAVSGSVILLYEEYNNSYGQDPLPSTIRGILYQTAEDLGNQGPDYMYGYWRIDSQRAIDLIREDNGQNLKITEADISNSEVDEYYIRVLDEAELKVTLVWDDKEASSGSGIKLMNNLDLVLISPSGVSYYPWVLNWSVPSAPATTGIDSRNNMEQVFVANPELGLWNVQVNGRVIPYAPQQYSLIKNLIWTNNVPVLDFIGGRQVNENEVLTIDLNAVDLDNDVLIYGTDAGSVLPSSFSFNFNTGLFEWTPTFDDSGIYVVTFNVSDGFSYDEETITITVNEVNRAPYIPTNPAPEDGGVNISVNSNISWIGEDPDGNLLMYDIYFGTDIDPPLVEENFAGTLYSPGTLSFETTYYWKIISRDSFGVETESPIWSFSTDEQAGYDYTPGDVNGNGVANGIDVVYFVSYLKGGGPPPVFSIQTPSGVFYPAADVNGNCAVNGIDVTYFVGYLKGGPALMYCSNYPPNN